MPRNPFSFSDDLEVEQNPAVSGTKQAAQQAGKTVVKQAVKQVSATTNAIVDQLYGVNTSSGGDTNETNAPAPVGQKQQTPSHSLPQSSESISPATNDEEKINNARRELHKMAYGQQFSIESQTQRVRAEERREKEQRNQQEEEERQRKIQAERSTLQNLEQPHGKSKDPRQKKRQMTLTRVQTKAERSRGTDG